MSDQTDQPQESPPQPEGPPVWAMDRVDNWIKAGCLATDPINLDARTLKIMEADGLLTINNKSGSKLVQLTGLGQYEADRLRHLLTLQNN